jgi:hypothetical protein
MWGLSSGWGLLILNAYCLCWFITKAMAVVFVQIWLRWTLPRIRIDQVLHACVKVLLPASLIAFLGTAAWVWLVPQPAAPEVHYTGAAAAVYGATGHVARLGHLVSSTPALQLLTQIALTLLGVLVIVACKAVVVHALLTRNSQPRRSMFEDVMPVGRDVTFTVGKS